MVALEDQSEAKITASLKSKLDIFYVYLCIIDC